jgi:hypothetical protein
VANDGDDGAMQGLRRQGVVSRLVALAAALVLGAGMVVRFPQPAAAAAPTGYAAWEVPLGDIAGLGSPRPKLLVKAFSPANSPVAYLDEAARHGQQVLVYFTETVDYAAGTVRTSVIPARVSSVKNHPALYGYLSVKEPSWNRISLAEMRSLYTAYRKADTGHPVVALLGDTPHFGTSANPWGPGVANVLWVDWYPVTYSRGYIGTASTNFPKVKAYVAATTPGTPIWLMVQGHGYKAGDKRTPTAAELRRQVADGLAYLGAAGIAFYTWRNPLYDSDFSRNPSLWATARSMIPADWGVVVVSR